VSLRFLFALVAATGLSAPFPSPPTPAPTGLPEIGRTRARPLCGILREAIAPAILAAERSDASFSAGRTVIDDMLRNTLPPDPNRADSVQPRRTLDQAKLERLVAAMAADVAALKKALDDPRFRYANADPKATGDGAALDDLHSALTTLYDTERYQLDVLSGYLATQQMNDFGENRPYETLRASEAAPSSSHAALQPRAPPPISLTEADLFAREASRIAAVTDRRERSASAIVIAAARVCR